MRKSGAMVHPRFLSSLGISILALVSITCSAQDEASRDAAPPDPTPGVSDDDEYSEMRHELLKEIERDVRSTRDHTGRSTLQPEVMEAMGKVPRHEFVPEDWRAASYANRPLPIGEGQTISQPYIVALMTDLLDPASDDVVLDIGTGSGYQAAVLAELVSKVYSMEIVPALAESATARLERLGYDNVEVALGNGWLGWPEHAPFDGIVVAASADELPQNLVDQLKPGAKLVVPLKVGPFGEELTVVEKLDDGSVARRAVLPVRFVPMTGEH